MMRRLFDLLCRIGLHEWRTEIRWGKTLAFYTRRCAQCHEVQIRKAGPMGNGKWFRESECFMGIVGDFERREYSSAKVREER